MRMTNSCFPPTTSVTRIANAHSDEALVLGIHLNVACSRPLLLESVARAHFLGYGADVFVNAIDAAAGVDCCSHILHHPGIKYKYLQAVADGQAFGARWHSKHDAKEAGEERQGHAHRIRTTRQPQGALLVGYSGHARVFEGLCEEVDGPAGLIGSAQDFDALEGIAERVEHFIVGLLEVLLGSFDFFGVLHLNEHACNQQNASGNGEIGDLHGNEAHCGEEDHEVDGAHVYGVSNCSEVLSLWRYE